MGNSGRHFNEAFANRKETLPSEYEYNRIRDMRREMYDASGVIHPGKHNDNGSTQVPINQGFYTDTSLSNQFFWGGGDKGDSETIYPVLNIAGHEIHVRGIHHSDPNTNRLVQPGAEDGTRISDLNGNCRGSGKTILDLKTDIDPKYGNTPTGTGIMRRNEAVARAFEGEFINGDGRFAVPSVYPPSWDSENGTSGTVTHSGGVYTATCISGRFGFVRRTPVSDGMVFTFTLEGTTNLTGSNTLSVMTFDAVNSYQTIGTVTPTPGVSTTHSFKIKGNIDRIHLLSTASATAGDTLVISNFSIKSPTEDVIIRRVDCNLLDVFVEEDDEEFYPYGSVQTGLTSIDGIPLEPSSRPVTYREAFDGDLQARSGLCLKVAKLTFEQIARLMANPKHNWRWGVNGKPIQTRYRHEVAFGIGNGDWKNVDPSTSKLLQFGTSINLSVKPQGALDVKRDTLNDYFAPTSRTEWNSKPDIGVFTTSKASGDTHAYKGECYALVLCTVPRLNMGGYTPLNIFGCAYCKNPRGVGWGEWHGSMDLKYTAQTFNEIQYNDPSGIGFVASGSKSLGSTARKHDMKFYDVIYSGGLNGIIDHRQPAKSPQNNWGDYVENYFNGKVRGIEKLPFTKPLLPNMDIQPLTVKTAFTYDKNSRNGAIKMISTRGAGVELVAFNEIHGKNAKYFVLKGNNGKSVVIPKIQNEKYPEYAPGDFEPKYKISYDILYPDSAGVVQFYSCENVVDELNAAFPLGTEITLEIAIEEYKLDTSVSGEFTCTAVNANPDVWLKVPQLRDGVMGVWNPIIFNHTRQSLDCVRKAYSYDVETDRGMKRKVFYVTNTVSRGNLSIWNTNKESLSNYPDNSIDQNPSDSSILSLMEFTSMAGIVESSDMWEKINIFTDYDITKRSLIILEPDYDYNSTLLYESVTNKAPVGGGDGHVAGSILKVIKFSNHIKHTTLEYTDSHVSENSKALKILPILFIQSDYLYIGYVSNPMIYKSHRHEIDAAKVLRDGDSCDLGDFVKITTGPLCGIYRVVSPTGPENWNTSPGYRLTDMGVVVDIYNQIKLRRVGVNLDWGTDLTFHIPNEYEQKFTDLNGIIHRAKFHIGCQPIGPVKKQEINNSSPAVVRILN